MFAFPGGSVSKSKFPASIMLMLILISPMSTSFSNAESPLFVRTWGWRSGALGNGVTLDSAGNIYVTGEADGASGSGKVLLLKYNQAGSLIWQKVWGGANLEVGYGVTVDLSGNVYVTGSTRSFNPWRNDQAFVLKFNSSGNLVWQKALANFTYAYGVALDRSGEIYVTGSVNFLNNSRALILLKIDSDGTVLWQKEWTGILSQEGFGIVTDDAGSVYVTGTTSSYDIYFPNGTNPLINCGLTICGDGLLLKFNSSGSLQWQTIWRRTEADIGRSIAIAQHGELIVGGWTYDRLDSTSTQVWGTVSKFAGNGSLLWERAWRDNATRPTNTTSPYNHPLNNTRISGVGVDPYGNIFAIGSDAGNLYLMRLDLTGRLQSQTLMTGRSTSGDGAALTFDSNGTPVIVGAIHGDPSSFQTNILHQTLDTDTPPTTVPAGILRNLNAPIIDVTGTVSDIDGNSTYGRGSNVWLNYGSTFAAPFNPTPKSPSQPPLSIILTASAIIVAGIGLFGWQQLRKKRRLRIQSLQ